MFVLQMTLAAMTFMVSVFAAIQTIVDDNDHVRARKLLVSAVLLAIVAYLIK